MSAGTNLGGGQCGAVRYEVTADLDHLLAASELLLQKHEIVAAALDDYRHGRADFADYLIALDNLEAGCETTLTFDRKAARHPAFKLIQ